MRYDRRRLTGRGPTLEGDRRLRPPRTRAPVVAYAALFVSALIAAPIDATTQDLRTLPAEDRVVSGTVEELFTVGALTGDVWEQFGRVRGIAFDGQSRLIIPDMGNDRVVVVDGSGDLSFEFGRSGEGPGEFGAPHGAVVLSDGTIVISDTPNQAHIRFSSDGSYLGQTRYDFGSLSVSGTGTRYPFGPDAFLYRSAQPFGEPTHRIFYQPVTEGDRRLLVEFSDEGVENSGVSRSATGGIAIDMTVDPGARRVLLPELRWGVLGGDRVATATSVEYAIDVRNAEGDVESVLTRPVSPREVTRADRDIVLERERQRILEGGVGGVRIAGAELDVPESEIRAALDAVVFPERIPVIERITSDFDGRLWVQRFGAVVGEEGPIDVLDSDGTYLFTLRGLPLPDAFGPDGLAAYLESGEFDEPLIRVVRIPEAWR